MLDSLISLLMVIVFAFAIHRIFYINSALTPIISLTTLICITMAFAMVGLLKPGVLIAYAIAVLFGAAAIYKSRKDIKNTLAGFFSPGVILFCITSFAMLAFLYLRQPLMSEWDEFSFWGISQKLVKIHDSLYTYYKSSMIGNTTPPTLAVLSYFFQTFSAVFAEWKSFFAYDVMFFAAFSAFTAKFDKKSWSSAFMVYLFGFLIPYVFEVYTKIIYLEPVYISTYADIPLGILFAAGVAVYFFSQRKSTKDILPLVPILIFLTLVKDMGFALSCIIIFIIFFDLLLQKDPFVFLKIKGIFAKFAASFTMLGATAGAFIAWAIHMGKVMEVNRFELGGETNMGMAQMVITGIKELFSPIKSEKFTIIQGQMVEAFFKSKISMLGSGVILVLIITTIFIFAWWLCKDKQDKNRVISLYITAFIGFIGYYVFHLFLYVYIFKDNAYGLTSYNRYIYPYYIGWMCFAIFALCLAVYKSKNFIFAKGLLFAFVLGVFCLFKYFVSYENMFIECDDRSFALRKNIGAKTEYLQDVIQEDDIIYCYSGGDNGERWFIYTFELAQNLVVQDVPYLDVSSLPQDQQMQAEKEHFLADIKKKKVTHILVDHTGELTHHVLKDLFDVSTGEIGLNRVGYYEVKYEQDEVRFVLVKGGVVTNDPSI